MENKTLILVHGASANADSWMPVIPYFSERVNVIALDMPGHYRSGGRLRESIAEMADFITIEQPQRLANEIENFIFG